MEQKVDQMSKERPLLDVISAFNKLCLLIKEKSAEPCQLREVSSKLKHEFESDFAVLARLLPKIMLIFPNIRATTTMAVLILDYTMDVKT